MPKFAIVSKYENEGISLPTRATHCSAGYDMSAAETVVIPSLWKALLKNFSSIGRENLFKASKDHVKELIRSKGLSQIIKENCFKPTLVPLGVKAYMGKDEYLALVVRSSTPSKKGLIMSNGVGIIDSDYADNVDNEGLIFAQLINFLPFDVTINKGDRICQGIFHKFILTDDDSLNSKVDRVGGHGHTDETIQAPIN